jgi:hypothetical protein
MTRITYDEALARSGIMTKLAAFDPHVAGTPPLGIELPTSDIDILCESNDLNAFSTFLREVIGTLPDFSLHHHADLPAVIARFSADGWSFEIFGQPCPVSRQHGQRHFLIERRLLALGGPSLRDSVLRKRQDGLKTEPAFAALLGLSGDPYMALLALEEESDDALGKRLTACGFSVARE